MRTKQLKVVLLVMAMLGANCSQGQSLRKALKELKNAVNVESGSSGNRATTSNSGGNIILVSNLQAIGDPLTGQIYFTAEIRKGTYEYDYVKLRVETATDNLGNVSKSYSYATHEDNSGPCDPVLSYYKTKIYIEGNESVVVSPDAKMLSKVVLGGTNGHYYELKIGTYTNIPIQWKSRENVRACWPAEYYVSTKRIIKGTTVQPYLRRIEIAKKSDYNQVFNDGNYIQLSGVVGNRKTGEVRIIIKFQGKMDYSHIRFFDNDGNVYEKKGNAFLQSDNQYRIQEMTSVTFKVPTSNARLQKLIIDKWTFTDVPIQWVNVEE